MSKLNVCVLFGGVSPEHAVSLRSAESVLDVEGLMAKSMAGVRRFRIKNDGTMREILPREPKESE